MISANLATFSARRDIVNKAIASLLPQVDIVRVWYNDYQPKTHPNPKVQQYYNGVDITDKGKFAFVEKGNEIYLSCDDDIVYPVWYSERMKTYLDKFPNSIITFHVRKLIGTGRDYYRGHQTFHFLRDVRDDTMIDVPGTGVSGFRTDQFTPDILKYPEQRMADVLLGLEAAKACKSIICLSHSCFDFKSLSRTGIFQEDSRGAYRQSELSDEIYRLKNRLD